MVSMLLWAFIVVLSDGRGLPAGPYESFEACQVVHAQAEVDENVVMLTDCIKVNRKLPNV